MSNNLEKFGVQELNINEQQETEGGLFFLPFLLSGIACIIYLIVNLATTED